MFIVFVFPTTLQPAQVSQRTILTSGYPEPRVACRRTISAGSRVSPLRIKLVRALGYLFYGLNECGLSGISFTG